MSWTIKAYKNKELEVTIITDNLGKKDYIPKTLSVLYYPVQVFDSNNKCIKIYKLGLLI